MRIRQVRQAETQAPLDKKAGSPVERRQECRRSVPVAERARTVYV